MSYLAYIKKNWPSIFTIVILFISLITLFEILNFTFNNNIDVSRKRVTIEAFGPSSSKEFIEKVNDHDPVKLNEICKSFSKDTCKTSSFCVLLDGEKCVGGSLSGPTFLTDSGKDVDFKYYIHKNKCRGECPNL